jgi:hypothetical protein
MRFSLPWTASNIEALGPSPNTPNKNKNDYIIRLLEKKTLKLLVEIMNKFKDFMRMASFQKIK